MTMMIWQTLESSALAWSFKKLGQTDMATQNGAEAIGLPFRPPAKVLGLDTKKKKNSSLLLKSHLAASGNTLPGPTRLGAVARATITQTDPIIWANARVAQT